MADYAIHEETLTDVADVIRKKDGTSALIDPADYADRINLMGMLEEKTASGSIANFSDGADAVPLKSWEVTLPASLDGYSSVDVVATGKNLANVSADTQDGLYHASVSYPDNGVSVSATGTYSRCAWIIPTIVGVQYTLSYKGVRDNEYGRVMLNDTATAGGAMAYGTQVLTATETAYTKTFTATSNILYLIIYNTGTGTTGSTTVTDIQLEVGSTPTQYIAYTAPTQYTANLGRTIYGGTADIVNGTAEPTNLLDETEFETYSNWRTDIASSGSYPTGNANRGFELQVEAGVTYAVSFGMDSETYPTYLYLCRTNGVDSERLIYFSGANYSVDNGTFTAESGWTYYFRLGSTGTEANFNGQIAKLTFEQVEKGATVTPHSPYFAPFTFTPITPTPETALGTNNFWADEGDSEVTYRSSGTITPILPTLVTKTITENGTYSAEDDDADGYSEVTVNVESIVKIGINSGKLNITNGTITADSAYCYTDPFDCPSGIITMDVGEGIVSDYAGIELIYESDGSHANYWQGASRYREVDLTNYYSATKKARLAFKKQYLSKVLLMDFGNGKIYSSLNASQFEEPQANLLSMNNAQSEESEGNENE